MEGAEFGNVCLGGVAAEPVDDSTGDPLAGLEVRLEEVSVPGILENEPSLPRTTTGTPDFGGLLPGTYRVVSFLPEGDFTTDPDAVLVEGRFAIVKEVTVSERNHRTAGLDLHTAAIEAIQISGNVAWVWGKVDFEGTRQRFRLRLVDAGEPGREDRFELTVASGYEAGQGETITGGNVQIHP